MISFASFSTFSVDALEERVRERVVAGELPGDGEDAGLAGEQTGAGGGGELDARM